MKTHPPECRELARKLRAEGMSYPAIARRIWTLLKIEVSDYSVRSWCKQ